MVAIVSTAAQSRRQARRESAGVNARLFLLRHGGDQLAAVVDVNRLQRKMVAAGSVRLARFYRLVAIAALNGGAI